MGDVFRSAINPPTSGNDTFDAYVTAAKAIGLNAPAVGCCSLDPQVSIYLPIDSRFPTAVR